MAWLEPGKPILRIHVMRPNQFELKVAIAVCGLLLAGCSSPNKASAPVPALPVTIPMVSALTPARFAGEGRGGGFYYYGMPQPYTEYMGRLSAALVADGWKTSSDAVPGFTDFKKTIDSRRYLVTWRKPNDDPASVPNGEVVVVVPNQY